MPPPVIPVVLAWGTPQHLRYVITDTSGRFWTGKTWSARQRDAMLYAGHSDAGYAAQRILLRHFRRCPVFQTFSVPLEMQVYADAEIGPDELKGFAKKAVKLSALFADHGTGPRPDSLVLPRINWRKLTQPVNSEREQDCHE